MVLRQKQQIRKILPLKKDKLQFITIYEFITTAMPGRGATGLMETGRRATRRPPMPGREPTSRLAVVEPRSYGTAADAGPRSDGTAGDKPLSISMVSLDLIKCTIRNFWVPSF